MRVIYSSHSSASRDRYELRTSLQMLPLGNEFCNSIFVVLARCNNSSILKFSPSILILFDILPSSLSDKIYEHINLRFSIKV